jgi:adenylate cyclase
MPRPSPQEEWRDFLSGTHPHLNHPKPFRLVPSSPRCRLCAAPFRAPGSVLFRRFGFAPWEKNPNLCKRCFTGLQLHASMCPGMPEEDVHGAEVEVSMLFADIRGSSDLARRISTMEFTHLMNRFYRTARQVLVDHDAIVEKFVGDEVVGLFLPFLAGTDHPARALDAADSLLDATGHRSADGPWVPLGVGVHTGTAFVGIVGSKDAMDFTALGDPVNLAAHLASQAATGEIMLTDAVADAVERPLDGSERRTVTLKGFELEAVVLRSSADLPIATTPDAAAGRP